MNPKEFERAVVRHSHFRDTELDQRTRALREAQLLPSGPRGRHAPDIAPAAAALIVCSLAAPMAIEAATFVATRMTRLVETKGRVQGGTFGEALTATLDIANWKKGRKFVAEIRINQTFPSARIVKANGEEVIFHPADDDLSREDRRGAGGLVYSELVLRAGFLHTLAGEIADLLKTESGWRKSQEEKGE